MKEIIWKILRLKMMRPLTHQLMKRYNKRSYNKLPFDEWQKMGSPVPPPHLVKQLIIQEYQQKSGYKVLVETGTFLGDMVEAQKTKFKTVISIELDVDLFKKAKEKFKEDKNVMLMQGDSGKVLPEILKDINEPAIFWLDGHYCAGVTAKGDKECPIFEELDAIFDSKKLDHILLIDDARLFNGERSYPTEEKLTDYIKSKNEKYIFQSKHDIIRYIIEPHQ